MECQRCKGDGYYISYGSHRTCLECDAYKASYANKQRVVEEKPVEVPKRRGRPPGSKNAIRTS